MCVCVCVCVCVLNGWMDGWTGTELPQSVAHALVSTGVVDHLCEDLARLEFEARKDGALVFNSILRKKHNGYVIVTDRKRDQ